MTHDNTSSRSKTITGSSRRTLVRAAAWAAPVATVATAAPAVAVSNLCEPVSFIIEPNQEATDALVLTGHDPAGHVYTVTISSSLGPDTVVGQSRAETAGWPAVPYVNHNMSTSGSGWQGGMADDGRWDTQFSGFAPGSGEGAIVLNQRAGTIDGEGSTHSPNAPSQTLTFEFTRDGSEFTPENLTIDVFDITSATPPPGNNNGGLPNDILTYWRGTYWDTVGFSIEPSSITAVSGYELGVGLGTTADPYRRSGESQPTIRGETVMDAFTFDSFPSGSTLTYGNNGRFGWHFVSIAGITFEVGNCT